MTLSRRENVDTSGNGREQSDRRMAGEIAWGTWTSLRVMVAGTGDDGEDDGEGRLSAMGNGVALLGKTMTWMTLADLSLSFGPGPT